jgi:hypothetical protein
MRGEIERGSKCNREKQVKQQRDDKNSIGRFEKQLSKVRVETERGE